MCYPLKRFKGDLYGEGSPGADDSYVRSQGGENLGHRRPVKGREGRVICRDKTKLSFAQSRLNTLCVASLACCGRSLTLMSW